jgi:hypothetical protein
LGLFGRFRYGLWWWFWHAGRLQCPEPLLLGDKTGLCGEPFFFFALLLEDFLVPLL